MTGILFALLSALGFASTNVLTEMGLKDAQISRFAALLINLTGGSILLIAATAIVGDAPRGGLSWAGILYFAAAGLMTALAGQAALLGAIHRIGATRTACFVLGDNVFAVILGFVVLGQTVSLLSATGIVVLLVGAVLFTLATVHGNGPAPAPGVAEPRSTALAGTCLALLSALCFASGAVLRGLGIALIPAAVFGSAVNVVAGLVVLTAVFALTGRLREPLAAGRKGLTYLLLSGVGNGVGTLGFILALQSGVTVAITTALKNTSPIFTFAFALILLQRHERLTPRLGLLVLVLVAGGMLTALGRA